MTASSSGPLMWPAEWARSESFWREVATRTLAGVFSLVLLGAPGVFYAVSFGALTEAQGWMIAIGAGLLIGFIVAYLLLLWLVRLGAKLAKARVARRASSPARAVQFARRIQIAAGVANGVLAAAVSTVLIYVWESVVR